MGQRETLSLGLAEHPPVYHNSPLAFVVIFGDNYLSGPDPLSK